MKMRCPYPITGHGLISSAKVEAAMLSVDRAKYVSDSPYQDSPQLIGMSRNMCLCPSLLPPQNPSHKKRLQRDATKIWLTLCAIFARIRGDNQRATYGKCMSAQ
jgi:hypothetical protein